MRKELKTAGTEANQKQGTEVKEPSLYDKFINSIQTNQNQNNAQNPASQNQSTITDSQADQAAQETDQPKKGVIKDGECICEGGGGESQAKEAAKPIVEKQETEEVKPLDEQAKKALTLEEIKEMEGAEAGEEDDGGGGDLWWTQYGWYRVPDSLPRDLGIFWKNFGEYKLYLPPETIELVESGVIPPPDECIPPELHDDCAKVFESGLKCGSDHDLHPCDIKPTHVMGNLLANDTLFEPGTITQVQFDGNIYTPDANGVIKINTGHSILLVYTQDFVDALGPHVAGDYFYKLYDNVEHPCEQGKNILEEIFTYTVTNSECPASDHADLIIKIKDDVPKAFDDPTKCVEACDKVHGNVLCNDVPGADKPVRVISFTYDDCTKTVEVPQGGSTTVTTALGGTLTVFSNGEWCYEAPKGDSHDCKGSIECDGFKYTIQDTDCDTSSAEQPIKVKFPAEPPPEANDDCNIVWESGLAPCDCDDKKPTEARGNLLCNDNIKGEACLTEICFDGQRYTPNQDGIIIVDTELGLLKVFTKDFGNHDAGDYIYKLQDNSCEGDCVKEVFKYTLESKDCCEVKDSAELTIKIIDAEPHAENDPTQCVMGCEKKIEGNVLSNDCSVDDIRVKSFTYNHGCDTACIEEGQSTTVTTKLGGILTVNSNGEWCYISPEGGDCGKAEDGFKYTLIDCDGDTDCAEQPINVLFPPKPDANDDCDIVYEAGLPCGSNHNKPTEATGNLLDNDDVKGDACITEICFDGHVYKPNNGLICIETENGTLKVYTKDAGSYDAGDYIYTLNDNAQHPCDDGKNIIEEEFQYKLEGKDDCCDNSDKATLTIKIVDDVPKAHDDCEVKVDKCGEKVCGNVLNNDTSGADKPIKVTSITYNNGCNTVQIPECGQISVYTIIGALLTVHSDGSWSYESPDKLYSDCDIQDGFKYTISDSDKDLSSAELPITVKFDGHKDEPCQDDHHSGPICQPPVDCDDDKPRCDDKPPVACDDDKPDCDTPPVYCDNNKPPVICNNPPPPSCDDEKPPVSCDKPVDCDDKPDPKECEDNKDPKDKDCDKVCDRKDNDKDCKDDKHNNNNDCRDDKDHRWASNDCRDHDKDNKNDHCDHKKDNDCDMQRICGNAIEDCDNGERCDLKVVGFKYYNEHNECVEAKCGQEVTTRSGARFTMYENGDYEHNQKNGKSFEDHISFKTNDKDGHKIESKFSIHTDDRKPDFRGDDHKDKDRDDDDYLVDSRDASPRMKLSMEDMGMRYGKDKDSSYDKFDNDSGNKDKGMHGVFSNHHEDGGHSSFPLVQIEYQHNPNSSVEHHIQQVQQEVHVVK